MNHKIRTFLNYSAIAIFVIASCFFIFISFGYNYSFTKRKFEKTSVIYVKSYPRGAYVFMNSKKYKNQTPIQINYLKPDSYKIEVEKDKYQKWQKQIIIKVDQAVFLENISLFFNNPEISELKSGNFKELSISPSKEMLLFYDNLTKELNLFDIKTEKTIKIEENLSDIEYSLWSYDNQKILLKSQGKYYLSFYYLNKKRVDLTQYLNFKPKSFIWDKYKSELLYILDNNGNVYSFNSSNNKLEDLKLKNIIALKPEGDKIFYIQKQKDKTMFTVLDKNSKDVPNSIQIADSENYEFLEPNRDYFSLLDKSSNTMYLMDPNTKDYVIKTLYNVKSASWDLYNRTLLLKNDFEIWSYDVNTKEEKIINRLSRQIDNSFWHRNNNHVFYISGGELKVVEFDDRWGRNEFSITNNITSKYILANRRGNILYYITEGGLEKNIIQ